MVERMEDDWISEMLFKYNPAGKRGPARPQRWWKEQFWIVQNLKVSYNNIPVSKYSTCGAGTGRKITWSVTIIIWLKNVNDI